MKRTILAASILALVACGGGGSDDNRVSNVSVPDKITLEVRTSQSLSNPAPTTPTPNAPPPTATTPPPAANQPDTPISHPAAPSFVAELQTAPPPNTYICGIQLLEVRGSGLKNVELVRDNSYERVWNFTTQADGTYAWAWFDPRAVTKNGEISLRILAWDKPAGQMANEIVVMTPRSWIVSNNAPPCLSPDRKR